MLLDQGVSLELLVALRSMTSFVYSFAYHEGWSEVNDGELLTLAERAGFVILLTTDQNIARQQNLTGRKISIVTLGTADSDTLVANTKSIVQAIQRVTRAGHHQTVHLTTPTASQRKSKRPH